MSSVHNQTLPVKHMVALDDKRRGPAVLRNGMVEACDSDWILPLDDDDLLDPDHVEIGSHYTHNADIVYGWCRVEGSDWNPNRMFNRRALTRQNYIPVTAMIRKKLFMKLGGYRATNREDKWWGFEDWNLWLRALKAGARFQCVPEVTWTYRINDHEHMIRH